MPKLVDLQDDQCHYPITADAPFVFCGRKKAPGKAPYCPRHRALCVGRVARPLEEMADWINNHDPLSSAAKRQHEERVVPTDEVIKYGSKHR